MHASIPIYKKQHYEILRNVHFTLYPKMGHRSTSVGQGKKKKGYLETVQAIFLCIFMGQGQG